MPDNLTVYIRDHFFTETERVPMEHEGLRVSLFKYDTSVPPLG